MKLFRPLPAALAAILFGGSVWAGTVSLISGPTSADLQGALNQLINSMNVAFGTAGGASLGDVIYAPTVTAPVNLFSLTAGATGVAPLMAPGGSASDSNIGIVVSGKGTGAFHAGGSTAANASLRVPTVTSAVNQVEIAGAVVTTGIPYISVGGTSSDTNAAISLSGKGTGVTYLGGQTATLAGLAIAQTASRVNNLVLTPGATGTVPSLVTGGGGVDTNIGMAIAGNGTGAMLIGGTTATLAGLQVAQTASRVNNIVITPAATGTAASIAEGGAGADANRDLSVVAAGTGIVALGQARATCTGTTTATCQGQRFIVSITGLTTAAAGVESAAMTVTNASVVSAASIVHCQVNIYAGTGDPVATRVTPGTGTVSVTVTNVAASGSLNATVPIACVVF